MAAALHPQTAVVPVGVLEREPERRHRDRLAEEVGRVLVPAHFAADVRLLEDVHRLVQQRLLDAELDGELVQLRVVRERLEDRIEIVHRVPDLVDRELLRLPQHAALVERLLFEEAADRLARAQEVLLGLRLRFVLGRENRARLGWIERLDDLAGARAQRGDRARRFEPGDDDEAVGLEAASQRRSGLHPGTVRASCDDRLAVARRLFRRRLRDVERPPTGSRAAAHVPGGLRTEGSSNGLRAHRRSHRVAFPPGSSDAELALARRPARP